MHRRRFHLRFAKRNHIMRFLILSRIFRSHIFVRDFLEKGTNKTDMKTIKCQVSMYGIYKHWAFAPCDFLSCISVIYWKKSLCTIYSVWSKTNLIPGGMGGAKTDPQTCKMRTIFIMSLALRVPINNYLLYEGVSNTVG